MRATLRTWLPRQRKGATQERLGHDAGPQVLEHLAHLARPHAAHTPPTHGPIRFGCVWARFRNARFLVSISNPGAARIRSEGCSGRSEPNESGPAPWGARLLPAVEPCRHRAWHVLSRQAS